ncbi:MAG TPA: 2,3-bisphosphoglycerate-independent phosphoglycerate mutase [Myxococcota bacterium]|nr:2,3-bisphosphoglycerate-independent phosphoglycerate mutase [Myxococcota bacterium]
MTKPVALIVLDGFGLGDGGPADATAVAHAPFFARLRREFPMAKIETSGEAVGLPPGQMGNSEVGHMTLGAGRIIDMDMTRIGKALAQGGVERNPVLASALDLAAREGRPLHLLGLLSDGGVHSYQPHLVEILRACKRRGVRPALHAFLDGRDTPPSSGLGYLREIVPEVAAANGWISTVVGRYWAMDRDNRWERVQRAYDAMVLGEGKTAGTAIGGLEAAYEAKETDEFVSPTVVADTPRIADGDPCLFFNFRADRAREITNALTSAKPAAYEGKLERKKVVKPGLFVCLTEYDAAFDLPVAFRSDMPKHILPEELAARGLTQLRIAETEKYAHVTFFFNCGMEEPFPGEDRLLIPSPRDVATYDHKPEMSAREVTERLLRQLADGDYAFILMNYANPDMVGHTGVLPAAVKAVETIDQCLERVADAILAQGGELLITADHGNCELMTDPITGEPHTAHTTNPVPIWWVTRDARGRTLRDGGLADVAPTVLELMGLPAPGEMTGRSLLARR